MARTFCWHDCSLPAIVWVVIPYNDIQYEMLTFLSSIFNSKPDIEVFKYMKDLIYIIKSTFFHFTRRFFDNKVDFALTIVQIINVQNIVPDLSKQI